MGDICCACGGNSPRRYYFKTNVAKDNNLPSIFLLYSGLSIFLEDKHICRKCHDQLSNLHNNTTSFRKKRQESQLLFQSTPSAASSRSIASRPSIPSVSRDEIVTPPVEIFNTPFNEHNYNSSGTGAKKLKQSVSRELFPTISEHDHSYYSGAIIDKSSFSYPELVKSFFNEYRYTITEVPSFFNQDEKRTLQTLLHSSKELFIKHLLTVRGVEKIITKEISFTCKEIATHMNNRKRGFVSVLMQKDAEKMETFDWEHVANEFRYKFPLCLMYWFL